MEDKKCPRCEGAGCIARFSHISHGVCFRCWGSGKEPRTEEELRTWLVRARKEFRRRNDYIGCAHPADHPRIRREIHFIVSVGKRNRARLDALVQKKRANLSLWECVL